MNNSKVLNSVFVVEIISSKGLELGTSLYAYIDEEFEEDDDQDWIKL